MEKRAKAAGRVSRDVLLDAPLPQATKTYTVISHSFVINTIKQMLDEKGFVVTDEVYSATDEAQIAYGIFRINYGNDPELRMLFAFNNSYNKQLKFSCAVGAYVKTNETSILSKDGSAWIRMHTGTADDEAADTIKEQIENATAYFQQLQDDKNSMVDIKISRREYGELLGRLFVDAKLLGMEQVSLAKKEYEKPSFNYISEPDSLWTAYNHILVALAKSHPRTWMEQQKLVHFHMMTEFDFTVFDDEVPVGDPNQMSLVDLAATVENAGVANISDLPAEIPTQDEIDAGILPEADQEVLTEDDLEEGEEIVEKVELPGFRWMTKHEIVEEYGDILTAEQMKKLGIQLTLEEVPDILLNEDESAGISSEAYEEARPKLDPEEEAAVIIDEAIADGELKLSIAEDLVGLPEDPSKVQTEIETPEGEGVVDSVGDEVDVPDFFMSVQDVMDMHPDVELEVGLVLTIVDEECEILSISTEDVGLSVLTEEEPTGEVVVEDVIEDPAEEPVDMNFDIGEPDDMPPADSMLRTQSSDVKDFDETPAEEIDEDQAAEIEKAMEIMNSKVELSPAEQAIKDAIEIEVADLYGSKLPFTYKLSGDQYNISLESGESFILAVAYVESIKTEV